MHRSTLIYTSYVFFVMMHGQVFMNATLELQSAAAASLILKAHRGRKEKAMQHWDLSTSDTQVNENLFCHKEEVAAGYTTLQKARADSVRKPTQKVQHCQKMRHLSSLISPVRHCDEYQNFQHCEIVNQHAGTPLSIFSKCASQNAPVAASTAVCAQAAASASS